MKKNIYSAFGLNQREIFDQTSNAWKMMWEQLLMIAIYARQQYMQSNQSNADNFQQRMKMVHLLIREYHRYRAGSNPSFDKDIPEIFQKVLALIEDECGSTKIIEFLLDEDVSQFQTSKKRILSQMEQAKIAFSPTPAGYKRDYSYYSLYEILYDPIFYISKLMSIPVPDKQAIHSTVVITVYDYLVKNNRLLLLNENPMERNFKSIEDKELIILKNLSLLQGKDDIKKLVKGQIADFIGTDVYKVFNLLSDPFYNEENPQNKLFASIFTIRPEADEFNISLDRKALINLINLNQLDELALVMKSEIKKVVLNKNQGTRNFGIETKVDQASALEKISEWYIKAQTGLFNRVDQVPKLIASILEFDIRYFKGMFDPELGFDRSLLTKNHKNSYSPLQAKEIYLFVSAYIRNKLYYNDPRPDRKSLHGLLINHLVERDFPEDIFFHKNRMMETWATFEDEKQHQKMLDRFKRMPPYLDPQHKDYTEISYLINKQKELGNDENAPPYPLNSFFPLPLWASRFSKNNIVEEVPNKLS